jgi:hypothetical protein
MFEMDRKFRIQHKYHVQLPYGGINSVVYNNYIDGQALFGK